MKKLNNKNLEQVQGGVKMKMAAKEAPVAKADRSGMSVFQDFSADPGQKAEALLGGQGNQVRITTHYSLDEITE